MRLYHLDHYRALRQEGQAQVGVREAIEHLDRPGAVKDLKHQVVTWFALHQQVIDTPPFSDAA
jgi:tRNA A37 threonylcarbamoyladenosine biosynthesis protein TsaE